MEPKNKTLETLIWSKLNHIHLKTHGDIYRKTKNINYLSLYRENILECFGICKNDHFLWSLELCYGDFIKAIDIFGNSRYEDGSYKVNNNIIIPKPLTKQNQSPYSDVDSVFYKYECFNCKNLFNSYTCPYC
tara:strand:+ start:188 stop:583 length:396 start_codon:yes stop_codon:yes gene_type:complete